MTGHGMRAGVVLPGGTANQQLEQAILAEQAGWDGVFVWETRWEMPHDSPERMREIAERIAAGPPARPRVR